MSENEFRLLLGFAKGNILTGVDLGLRRAVKMLLDENRKQSEKLAEYGFKEATREYWERWALEDKGE